MTVGCFLPYVGLGSCLLHLPYIHKFAKKEGPVTVITFSKSLVDALKFDPNIKEIIVVEKYNKKLFDVFKLSAQLKKLNLKKLYIFKCSLRFYLAGKFSGIHTRSYPFYKKRNLHLVKEARKFTMKILGLENCETETKLYLDKKALEDTKKIMMIGKKNILIAPSSSGPTTMWKTSYFINLMKKLEKKFNCNFVIAIDSSEKEKKIYDEIAKNFNRDRIITLSDKTISQAMPIIACCNLSICNDTSFQHLSCQLGIQTIILKLDSPGVYSSYSKLQHSILPKGYSEVNHDTKASPDLINANEVFAKALELIS